MEQKLKTVPEWISRIREQLSVSYAGLGMKEKADYNRNMYLEILEDTRQDKERESRYQALEMCIRDRDSRTGTTGGAKAGTYQVA